MNELLENDVITFFAGLSRQAPGDDRLSLSIMQGLQGMRPSSRIADFGCGTGSATLLLAEHFHPLIYAIDLAELFLDVLMVSAKKKNLDGFIQPKCADMGLTDELPSALDLIWCEGSAYIIGFASALKDWHGLLNPGGILVVSECVWLNPDPPSKTRDFWQAAYPAIGSEEDARELAESLGYEVLDSRTLPESAWQSYYREVETALESPEGLKLTPDFRDGMREEAKIYHGSESSYGYLFLILRKT